MKIQPRRPPPAAGAPDETAAAFVDPTLGGWKGDEEESRLHSLSSFLSLAAIFSEDRSCSAGCHRLRRHSAAAGQQSDSSRTAAGQQPPDSLLRTDARQPPPDSDGQQPDEC